MASATRRADPPNVPRPLGAVPTEALELVVKQYKADVAMGTAVRKRLAMRALQRLAKACDAVRRALDELPEELQTFYCGDLLRGAAEIRHEADWRLSNIRRLVDQRQDRTPRARLEARVAELYEQHGGKLSTYDPSRYVEPRGGEGKRGGGLAKVLRTVYEMAGIANSPADLQPVLRRLVAQSKAG